MARNAIIYGLSKALVVVEAGERGGTLAAGLGAMDLGRPVLVLEFAGTTPPGNARLLASGAARVSNTRELVDAITDIEPQRAAPEPALF